MTDKSKATAVDLKAAGVDGWFYVLQQIADRRAELDALEEQAQSKIKEVLGDAVDGTIGDKPVVRWLHTAAPRNFDKKQFAEDHPDLVQQNTKVGKPGRRFELVKPKAAKK